MSIRNLHRLLLPASVAVFGASPRKDSIGRLVWQHLLTTTQHSGRLYAVNPKHDRLDGHPCYPNASSLPVIADLAVICTPADTVARILEEVATRGTKAAAVFTGRFSDEQLKRCRDIANTHQMRLLGPNTTGLITPRIGLNASLSDIPVIAGELAFVTQSGALMTAMTDWARSRGIGFSHVISLGQQADVDVGDLLDWLGSDPRTRAIMLYIEAVSDRREFMSAARAAARNKPVIIVKSGRKGRVMYSDHIPLPITPIPERGESQDAVYDAAFRRAGVLRVDTLPELFVAAQSLARLREFKGSAMTIVTNGSAMGQMAADCVAQSRIELATPTEAISNTLRQWLPADAAGCNPLDIGNTASPELCANVLRTLLATPDTGEILFIHAPTAATDSTAIARACLEVIEAVPGKRGKSRVIGCWLGRETVAGARRVFGDGGVAEFGTPEDAVRAMAMLLAYRRSQEQLLEMPSASLLDTNRHERAIGAIERALARSDADSMRLNQEETVALLRDYGVRLHPLFRTDDDARSDLAKSPAGSSLELFFGMRIDPTFGPIIRFGRGGATAEMLFDRAVALPPINRALAADLVSRTRASRLMSGWGARAPVNVDAVHDLLNTIAVMTADLPHLSRIELNPVLADHDGVEVRIGSIEVSRKAMAGSGNFAIRPYPVQEIEEIPWTEGHVVLRPIRPEDEPQHLSFLSKLTPEDVRMRVFYSRRELPRSELARLTQIDYGREMAFIAEHTRPDGSKETLGTVRTLTDPDNVEAEFAIIVRSDMKGKGLGRRLMEKIIRYHRGLRTNRIVGSVLTENTGMLKLVRKLGFVTDRSKEWDADVTRLKLPLQDEEVAAVLQD